MATDAERPVDPSGESRAAYLCNLAEDNDVDIETVRLLADTLGPEEDFDLLVTWLQAE